MSDNYCIWVNKQNDSLMVEALECLLAYTDDETKKDRIDSALCGLHLVRPVEWGLVKDIYKAPPDKSVNNKEIDNAIS